MDDQMNQSTTEPTTAPAAEPTYVTFEGDGAPAPVPQYVSYTAEAPKAEPTASETPKEEGNGTNGLSTASMILGISSLASWVVTCGSLSIPAAVLAVIFGLVGRVNGKITKQGKTGLICGIISLGIFVLVMALIVVLVVFMMLWAPMEMREAFLEVVEESIEMSY